MNLLQQLQKLLFDAFKREPQTPKDNEEINESQIKLAFVGFKIILVIAIILLIFKWIL